MYIQKILISHTICLIAIVSSLSIFLHLCSYSWLGELHIDYFVSDLFSKWNVNEYPGILT